MVESLDNRVYRGVANEPIALVGFITSKPPMCQRSSFGPAMSVQIPWVLQHKPLRDFNLHSSPVMDCSHGKLL